MKRTPFVAVVVAATMMFAFVVSRPRDGSTAWAHNPDPNDPLQSASPILKVADVPAAMKYFQSVLGFAEEFTADQPVTYAGVARGKVVFHLSSHADATANARLYIYVKGLDKLHEEVKTKGAQITHPPADQPYGMREFTVKTPDGHILIFAEGIEKK
jgi:uncharacterized glyoxalase superfamily protein PhnB